MRDKIWDLPDLQDFHGYLYTVNNGSMDVEGFIDSEYGGETARRLLIRSRIQNDRDEAAKFYASVGLRKEYFDWDDYYDRWTLLTPLKMEHGRSYPLVFWLRGGDQRQRDMEPLRRSAGGIYAGGDRKDGPSQNAADADVRTGGALRLRAAERLDAQSAPDIKPLGTARYLRASGEE